MSKILIMNAQPFFLSLCAKSFEHAGHTVVRAENGEDGLRLARQHMPDIIVLDLAMPRQDGFSVLEELRTSGVQAPVVVCTDLSHQDDIRRCEELGCASYLIRSHAGPNELLREVTRLLGETDRGSRV